MRILPLAFASAIFLGACLDAVGPGGNCTLRMRQVLSEEGQPNHEFATQDGVIWYYDDFAYVFRWGPSIEGCEASKESLNSLDLIPLLQLP